jgi:HK97 family phage major capsid protein
MSTTATPTPSPLVLEMKSTLAKIEAAQKGLAPRADLEALQQSCLKMQTQIDSVDIAMAQKHIGGIQAPPLVESLKSNEDVSRLLRDKRGTAVVTLDAKQAARVLQRKTNLLESTEGFQTTGVMPLDRLPGITAEARQQLFVRDLLTARPTLLGAIDFVKVSQPLSIASPVAEASVKPENTLVFTSFSERIKTIATWLPASRQILDDFQELASFINTGLAYYVRMEEELQMISGDGTAENLHGMTSQATAFNTALLPSAAKGWNKIDVIATAIKQIGIAKEVPPTFALLSVSDWWDIRLQKDSFGRYLVADPQSVASPSLFGITIVPTVNMSTGTFLVGSGDPAAVEIRDRMDVTVELSTSHSTFFTQNLVAVRAEERLALVVKRAASLIYGSFTTSP